MLRRIITEEIAGFMVGLIELTAAEFYDGDRAFAFKELNDKMIWHHFIEKYETKRSLSAEATVDEIGRILERERPLISKISLIDDNTTELVKKIIKQLGKKYNWNYSVSFDKFYFSPVCRMLSDTHVGLSALSFDEIIELFGDSVKE